MKSKGFIGKTFRSTSERNAVQNEISAVFLKSDAARHKFARTAERIQEDEGQESFRRLVYKISTNFRRRRRQPARKDTRRPVGAVLDENIGAGPRLGEKSSSSERSILIDDRGIMTIVRKDGAFKALCRPCELTRGWPEGGSRKPSTVDDLQWDVFLAILEADHAFDRKTDCLGFRGGHETQYATIDNDRQWKAVIAYKMVHGQPLNFAVVPRRIDDETRSTPRDDKS